MENCCINIPYSGHDSFSYDYQFWENDYEKFIQKLKNIRSRNERKVNKNTNLLKKLEMK